MLPNELIGSTRAVSKRRNGAVLSVFQERLPVPGAKAVGDRYDIAAKLDGINTSSRLANLSILSDDTQQARGFVTVKQGPAGGARPQWKH